MTAKPPDTSASFLAGHSASHGLLGVLAFPNMLTEDQEYCRFYTTMDGKWGVSDYSFDCKSLTYLRDPSSDYKAWWLLGRNGAAMTVQP